MKLSKLPKITLKSSKRLGRGLGSGKGAKCGKGTTRHQKAREDISLFFEGGQNRLTKKFPLIRGKAKNKSVYKKPEIVKIDKLNLLPSNSIVTVDLLINAKLVDERAKKNGVKIVDGEELKHPLIIKLPSTKGAKKNIEKAGGKIEL